MKNLHSYSLLLSAAPTVLFYAKRAVRTISSTSNRLNFWAHLVLYFLIVGLLPSCSLFITDKDKMVVTEDKAPFIVDQVKGEVIATKVNGLPEEIEISYTACFRDFIHQDNTIQGSFFKIHLFEDVEVKEDLKTGDGLTDKDQDGEQADGYVLNPVLGKKQTSQKNGSDEECSESSSFLFSRTKASCLKIRTDSTGCLNWTEVYPYRPVSYSAWLRYNRVFEGTGVNKGFQTVQMAVNPWLSTDPSGAATRIQLEDLRYDSVSQKRELISLNNEDIPQCRFCSANKNKEDCVFCEKKKKSLSSVIAHFEKKAGRPRLWFHKIHSNISQEHIAVGVHQPEEQSEALKQFKVCHYNMKENCDPPGRFFKVRLQIPLRIHVKDYRNEDRYPLLTRGNYSIKAYLFLKNHKGKHIVLHRDMNFISVSPAGDDNLKSEFYLHVPYEHYGLPAFLGLKVQAEGELKPFFLPFEGVFAFPNYLRTVIGKNVLDLEKSAEALYKKDFSETVSLMDKYNLVGSWEHVGREGFRSAGWDIKLNRFRFSDVSIGENKCATPVDRTISYIGEICIVDPLTGEVVPNTNIAIHRQNIFFSRDGKSREGEIIRIPAISKADNSIDRNKFKNGHWNDITAEGSLKEPSYISDTSGCLQWVDNLYHKWYNREEYFVRKMIFSKKEWGFEGERMIAINPWHWGFIFFQDITQLGHHSTRTAVKRKKSEYPQIVLHDFRSIFADPIYTIDRWLGINLFQNLLFLFRVRVDRPDNVSIGQGGQRPSAMDVRRGYYFLRFILVKSHTEESGGKGNQVVNDEKFRSQAKELQPWNTNTGWRIGRDGKYIGQMMHTNLEYITHFETYVQIRDSVVNAYTNFLFDLDEFIFIGSNNRLIVQLLPTDPKHYVYYPNSCEVDPSKSIFLPFIGHELISRPFMGTFVSGDQRNWNIFRVLDEYINLKLPSSAQAGADDDIIVLNMSPWQMEQFIRKEKENGLEHELFTKLQSHFVIEADNWGAQSRSLIKVMGPHFMELYNDINLFLHAKTDTSLLSNFNQNRNKLIESVDTIITNISNILKGSIPEAEQSFFEKIQFLLHNARAVLSDSNTSPQPLKHEMENIKKAFFSLIEERLSFPVSPKQRQNILQKNQDSYVSKWFKSDISFPSDSKDWSGFNMELFAKDEGLKLIAGDLVSTFVEDLNNTAKIHNNYHYKEKNRKTNSEREMAYLFNNETAKEIIQKRTQDHNQSLSFDQHKDLTSEYQNDNQLFWHNFELMEGDDYFTIKKKMKQMYLPDIFSKSWLNTVLVNGVHSGTLQMPEVMTFLHSLCGFWFDTFYEKYLEQRQLDIIYHKHMDHFRYYKGILDYLSKDRSALEQHNDLVKAMTEYNLFPIEKSVLVKQHPFLLQEDSLNRTVIEALYESLKRVLQEAKQSNQMSSSAFSSLTANVFFDILGSHRHPYFKCVANPLNFFHIEKKIIVGDIGSDYSDLKYEYGLTKSFNIQRAFDYAYSSQWSMSRSFSTSLGSGFTVLGLGGGPRQGALARFLNPLEIVNPFLSFGGVRLSSDWGTSRSDSDSNRRQQSVRFSDESLYLQLNHSVISIRLKNFRHCLVVRAKNMAFDGYKKGTVWKKELDDNFIHQIPYIKSGLMICSEDIDTANREPFYITEDYFYMYQLIPGDRGQFQNPLSFRNRPFVMSVRGVTEMEKLIFLIHAFVEADKLDQVEDYDPFGLMTNPYDSISKPADGTRKAIQQAKIWDKTGFYPGVYSVKYDEEHYLLSNPEERKKNSLERFGEWLYRNNPLGYIKFNDKPPVSQRGGKE